MYVALHASVLVFIYARLSIVQGGIQFTSINFRLVQFLVYIAILQQNSFTLALVC